MSKHLSTVTAGVVLLLVAGAFGQRDLMNDPFSPSLGAKLDPRFSAAARHVQARALASHTQVVRGQKFYAALQLQIGQGWVFYSPDPGIWEDYSPTPGRLSVSDGAFEAGDRRYPVDHPHETDLGNVKVTNNVYEGRMLMFVTLTVPANAPPGERLIELTADGQICSDTEFQCLNTRVGAGVMVTVGTAGVPNGHWDSEIAAALEESRTVGQLKASHAIGETPTAGPVDSNQLSAAAGLGLALLAGLILNIMPCVLPVIPLRILSIVGMAGESRRRYVTLGLAFSGGIILFFVGLAGINVGLRLATGDAMNWGKHFQNPAFTIGMSMLLVALAANLFGLFTVTVPQRVAQFDASVRRKQRHVSSLSMGVMMAILATPCSFAILLSALAWAQVQSLWLGTLGIVFIGVGMAAPHAVLTAFPKLVNKLPRPGKWTETFKQSMGFGLLLVAVWLISTITAQPSKSPSPFWVAAFAVVLVMCLWMWGTWVRYDAPRRRKIIVRTVAVAVALVGGFYMLRPPGQPAIKFAEFSEARITEARNQGRVVLVKFTADWCLSCGVLEYTIFNRADVGRELRTRGVFAVKGDVTRKDQPANEMLYKQFKGAPPLTVIFPPGDAEPVVLKGKFSKASLIKALDEAMRKG